MLKAKPIVKWLGGKTQLLPQIQALMPKQFNDYYEPFFGGGAVFFDLIDAERHNCYLSDLNQELMTTYHMLKHSPGAIIRKLDTIAETYNEMSNQRNKDQYYYFIRARYNAMLQRGKTELDDNLPALFIFLNKASFNGVYRVNRKGLYNVPTAHRKTVKAYDKSNLKQTVTKLQQSHLSCGNWSSILDLTQPRDFVFLDPPYYNTYADYQRTGFGQEQQAKLAKAAAKLAKQDTYVMITNSNSDYIKKLYANWHIHVVNANRSVNRNGSGRKSKDVIITSYKTIKQEQTKLF